MPLIGCTWLVAAELGEEADACAIGNPSDQKSGSGFIQIKGKNHGFSTSRRANEQENDCNTCVLSGWGPYWTATRTPTGRTINQNPGIGSPDGQWTLKYIDKYGYKVFTKPDDDGSTMFYNAETNPMEMQASWKAAPPKDDAENYEEPADGTGTQIYDLLPEIDPNSTEWIPHRYWSISSSWEIAWNMEVMMQPELMKPAGQRGHVNGQNPIYFGPTTRVNRESATMMCTLQQCGVALNMSVYENWEFISQNTECVCGLEPEAVEVRGKCDVEKGAVKANGGKGKIKNAGKGHNCTYLCDEMDDCNYYTSFDRGFCRLWSVCDFNTMITDDSSNRNNPRTYKKVK